jgi:hypothetical protein
MATYLFDVLNHPLFNTALAICLLSALQVKAIQICRQASEIPAFAQSWPLTRSRDSSTTASHFTLDRTTASYKQSGYKAPEGIDFDLMVWEQDGTNPFAWSVQLQNTKAKNNAPSNGQFVYTVHFGDFERSWYFSGLESCKIEMTDSVEQIPFDHPPASADLSQYNF